MYTIQKLAQMAGVSTRTLRYYDAIGLLKPARINASGYRCYGKAEVDQLQQILFYRELGIELQRIKELITSPDFNRVQALKQHWAELLKKRAQLDVLIANVEKTIAAAEGRITMMDQEKFAGFKQSMIEENERKYGKEARAKFGDAAVEKANAQLQKLTQEKYAALEALSTNVINTLKEAFATGDPAGELAQKAAALHRQWLSFFWDSYSKEAHAGLAQMYVEDERFTAFYDQHQPGATKFLRDAILIYTGMKKA